MLAALRATGRGLLFLPRIAGPLMMAGWAAVIWSLSAMEGGDEAPVFWKSWIVNCGHAPLFGFLAFLALVAFPRRAGWPRVTRACVSITLVCVLGYALTDEWHQSRVPGRDSSGLDIVTDLVGASTTLWIAAYLGREDATGRGLVARLALGLLLCALAGLAATLG